MVLDAISELHYTTNSFLSFLRCMDWTLTKEIFGKIASDFLNK